MKAIYTFILSCLLFGAYAAAPQNGKSGSMNKVKIEMLESKKAKLEATIAVEDSKRNAVQNGVSPETMESINIEQDHVCLELRSELTDINLEISELRRENLVDLVNSSKKGSK